MAKTKTPMTPVEELRRYAGHATGARWEDAQQVVVDLEERKDAAEEAASKLEDLEETRETLENLAEALDTLRGHGMASDRVVEALREAATLIDEASGLISGEDLAAFVEAYDEATQALENYSDTKEQDPFPGKRDEVESAWEESTAALEGLADALDTAEGAGFTVEQPADETTPEDPDALAGGEEKTTP